MTDRDSSSNELGGRMSKRLQDDKTSSNELEPEPDTAHGALKGNVRETREQKQWFLEPEQSTAIEREYKRLSYEYEVAYDRDLELNAHYYPVLAEFGLQEIANMDASDFDDALEQYHDQYESD